jgi:hypothetical protein
MIITTVPITTVPEDHLGRGRARRGRRRSRGEKPFSRGGFRVAVLLSATPSTASGLVCGRSTKRLLHALQPQQVTIDRRDALAGHVQNRSSGGGRRPASMVPPWLPRRLIVFKARTDREIEGAFASAAGQRASAIIISADPFFTSLSDQLVALAARHSLPAIYPFRRYTQAGGLM